MSEKKQIKKKTPVIEKKKAINVKKEEKPEEQKGSELKSSYVKELQSPVEAKIGGETFIGTGRRKTAIASVSILKGSGKIYVNSLPYEKYFCNRAVLLSNILSPLKETNLVESFDISAKVSGGGVSAQADAVRLGIARALVEFSFDLRKILRPLDLLKRDPRMKERKKYGLKKARKAFQYTKR